MGCVLTVSSLANAQTAYVAGSGLYNFIPNSKVQLVAQHE
jgi:hypothetical protein